MTRRLLCTLYIIALLLLTPVSSHAQTPKVIQETLESLGYKDIAVTGMYGGAAAFIPFQSNLVVTQDAQLNLIYTASPVLNRERSTLTVSVNDQVVYSFRPIGDGVEHAEKVFIPFGMLRNTTGILLRFEGYLRLTDDPCEETNNAGQWLTVSSKSDLQWLTQEDTRAPKLEALASSLIVQNSVGNPSPVVFVLPDQWNSTTLAAASHVATRLGQLSKNYKFPLQITTVTGLTPELKNEGNFVIIGKAADSLELPDQPASPTSGGFIKLITSPWNAARHMLIVGGSSDEELAQAGEVFLNKEMFKLLGGSVQSVASLVPAAVDTLQTVPWTSDVTTFAQLGSTDRQVVGSGIFNEYYDLQLPPGWALDGGAQFTLNLSYSPALHPDQSYVTILVNDEFVGTIPYSDKIHELQATFNLPVDKISIQPSGERTQRFLMQLTISNNMASRLCEEVHPGTAWTRISTNSYLRTPHKYLPWPDLQSFPYPFINDSTPAPIIIVVPSTPDIVIMQQALELSTRIGSLATSDLDISIAPENEITQKQREEAHLIVLGQSSKQPMVASLLKQLPPIMNEQVTKAFKNPDFGVLYEAISPWNPQRAVLLVFSESEEGYQNAVTALAKAVPPVSTTGSVAIIEAGQAPRVIYRAVKPAPTNTPTPQVTATTPATTSAKSSTGSSSVAEVTEIAPAVAANQVTPAGQNSVGNLSAPPQNQANAQPPETWKVVVVASISVIALVMVFIILLISRRTRHAQAR